MSHYVILIPNGGEPRLVNVPKAKLDLDLTKKVLGLKARDNIDIQSLPIKGGVTLQVIFDDNGLYKESYSPTIELAPGHNLVGPVMFCWGGVEGDSLAFPREQASVLADSICASNLLQFGFGEKPKPEIKVLFPNEGRKQ